MGVERVMSPNVRLLLMMMLCSVPYSLCSYYDEHGHVVRRKRISMPTGSQLPASSFSSSGVVIVTDYGAIGDGKSDDTEAFQKAWRNACSGKNGVLEVPGGKTFLVGPITFKGPCKYSTTMKVFGTILASPNLSDYEKSRKRWINFVRVSNLHVLGGGTFDGNGDVWWKNSCKINKSKPCKSAPTAVTFDECKDLRVETLNFINAQKMTVSFQNCSDVTGSWLSIKSPATSPNTDGIHVTGSRKVELSKCSIQTGDDCISIDSRSIYINASDISCGPGHGISIGNLGDHNTRVAVSDVFISRATLTGTTNGVRIKTYQGGSGYARNIKFEDITMNNVTNPIVINQNYCDQSKVCKEQREAVQVENVVYSNIRGTSYSKKAISIDCSKRRLCREILIQDINLASKGGGQPVGECKNAQVQFQGQVSPRC